MIKLTFYILEQKNSLILDTKLEYYNKTKDTKLDTKFLGIIKDSTLQWKFHTDSLLMKLSAARYVL